MSLMLDHYLDSLSTLPRDLAKNLQGIRKYDMECHKRSAEIDKKLRVFMKSHQKMPRSASISFNKEIMVNFCFIFSFAFCRSSEYRSSIN